MYMDGYEGKTERDSHGWWFVGEDELERKWLAKGAEAR